jgi:hypothetical protein
LWDWEKLPADEVRKLVGMKIFFPQMFLPFSVFGGKVSQEERST